MSRRRAESLSAISTRTPIASPRDVPAKRNNARSQTMPSPPTKDHEEVLIAVMGVTGSGKSTFINLLSSSNMEVSGGLKSCTSRAELSAPFRVFGRQVTLIDTPGFDDTTHAGTETLDAVAKFMAEIYRRGRKLSGMVYMHRISDVRMSGSARRNLNMFKKLCGEATLKNVVIVTNMWGEVTQERGEARERELREGEFFGFLLDRGAKMVRHDGTRRSAEGIIGLCVENRPKTLLIQRELVIEGKGILETEAGIELDRELAAMAKKYKSEMTQLTRDMEAAVKDRDAETHKELEECRRDLGRRLEDLEGDRERMRRRQANELASTMRQIQAAQSELQSERHRREEQETRLEDVRVRLERQRLADGGGQSQSSHKLRRTPRRAQTISSTSLPSGPSHYARSEPSSGVRSSMQGEPRRPTPGLSAPKGFVDAADPLSTSGALGSPEAKGMKYWGLSHWRK